MPEHKALTVISQCLNCGITEEREVHIDELGTHCVCGMCGASFDVN